MVRTIAAALAALLLAATGCTPGASSAPTTLTVFAAASLAESFEEIERRFEKDRPGVDVRVVLGGSSKLLQQLDEGARADVFATADEETMAQAAGKGLVEGEPAVFATNVLTIAVEPGNPRGVRGLADLARPGLTVVRCAPQLPCGKATDAVRARAGVRLPVASEEPDVKAVLGKVVAGEADAGLVYVTDVRSAKGAVDQVDFAESAEVVNRYPIAALAGSPRVELAREFVAAVRGEAGRAILARAGFGVP